MDKVATRNKISMASNFRIFTSRSSDSIHLKLIGDFDGSSAHALVNYIRENCKKTHNVVIHTSRLRSVHPFGRNTFHSHLSSLRRPSFRLSFIGDNIDQLAPY
jgi:hypothetical protein